MNDQGSSRKLIVLALVERTRSRGEQDPYPRGKSKERACERNGPEKNEPLAEERLLDGQGLR